MANNPEVGVKFDGEKDDWSLLPIPPMREIVKILTFGAKKYSPDNWKKVPDARRRYYAALMRHMTAWWEGERVDQESGRSHLAHAGCCLLFLLALEMEDDVCQKIPEFTVGCRVRVVSDDPMTDGITGTIAYAVEDGWHVKFDSDNRFLFFSSSELRLLNPLAEKIREDVIRSCNQQKS